jgi:hypothetical protein
MGAGNVRDSDGNRVNVGNFDADGLNVNNNWDDNRNDNLGLSSARQSSPHPGIPSLGGILYRLLDRTNPATEHPTDLVDLHLKFHIFAVVDCFHVLRKSHKHAKQVELHARGFEDGQLRRSAHLTCKQDGFKRVEHGRLATLPDSVAILLRNVRAVSVKGAVEIVGLLEDRYIKLVRHMKIYKNLFDSIVSAESLFEAWDAFKRDKRNKLDVALFERNIEREIFRLARELREKIYRHGPYRGFWIRDPKVRHIHKASVRDRVLHHAIFNVLNPIFEPTFISTSFSCRVGKGTHKGVEYLANTLRAVSRNNTRPCFALKCDVRKFFDSVDHRILLGILSKKIRDPDTLWLLNNIIDSHAAGLREREREY